MSRVRALRNPIAVIATIWGCMGLAPASLAATSTVGCASPDFCTLQELLAGGSLLAGGMSFGSFEIERDPGSIDFARLRVEPRDSLGLDPGPGLHFSGGGELQTVGTQSLDLRLGFQAQMVDGRYRVEKNSLEIDTAATSGGGQVSLDENAFAAGFRLLGWKDAHIDPSFGEDRRRDEIGFAEQPALYVELDLFLDGREAGDQAQLDEFTHRFAHVFVPEPQSSLLSASALITLAAFAVFAHSRAGSQDPIARQTTGQGAIHQPGGIRT